MILRERAKMKATAEQIWAILGDPRRMSAWNPHCVESEAEEDTVRVGLHFQATMRFGGGPERQLECQVIACEPPRLLTLRFGGEVLTGTDEHVDEMYVLEPVEGGTKVLHTVDLSHSGLPRWLQVVVRIMDLLGGKRGTSELDCLKELCEGASS